MLYRDVFAGVGFVVIFMAWATSELIGPVRWSRGQKGEKRDKGSIVIGSIIASLGVVLSLLFPWLFPNTTMPLAAYWIGMLLVFVGAYWRWYSIKTLGQLFTATVFVQENQAIIQHGPYAYIRHPGYTGVLVVMIGLGCLIGNWLSVLSIFLGLFAPLLYRIKVEEDALQKSNHQYQEYMRKTKWRLIPFLF